VELAVVFAAAAGMLSSATFLGFLYEVLRCGLLLVGIRLMEGDGVRRPVGYGLVAANVVFLLVDGLGNVHTTGDVWAWLQLALAVAIVAVLGIRLWPFEQVPRRLALVPPTQRPLAWVTIGAAAVEMVLLLSAIPADAGSVTIGGVMGPVAGLLAVLPWAGLCVVAVLARTVSAPQRLFVTAAVVAYAGPEVFFMLGSILLGANFTYVGDDVWDPHGTAAWFPLLHAAATIALAGTAVARLHRRV
jgi:hypothetical protein